MDKGASLSSFLPSFHNFLTQWELEPMCCFLAGKDALSAGRSHSRYLCCSMLGLPEGPENTVGIVLGWLVFCPEAVWSAGNPSLLFSDIWTAKGL